MSKSSIMIYGGEPDCTQRNMLIIFVAIFLIYLAYPTLSESMSTKTEMFKPQVAFNDMPKKNKIRKWIDSLKY